MIYFLKSPIVFESYEKNRDLGSIIVIDLETNNTSGAGRINYALRRASNIHLQNLEITKEKDQKSKIKNLVFCGLLDYQVQENLL